MMDLSYQLYSSRSAPLDDTLGMLSDLGYTQVEGYEALLADLSDPRGFRERLDGFGLRMPTAHIGLDRIETDPLGVSRLARDIGVETIFVPALPKDQRPDDAEGWQTFGRRLALAGKPMQSEGLSFGWHNHDFEFGTLDAAERPLDLILSGGRDLVFEIDVAWVQVAGEDPLYWIEKYADRIVAAHVKDIAPAGEARDEDGWADPGHGTMDWPALAAALRRTGCRRFVVEHDNPNDHARFARRALETARRL